MRDFYLLSDEGFETIEKKISSRKQHIKEEQASTPTFDSDVG